MISRVIGMDAYCSRQNHFEILVGNKEDKPVNEEYVAHGNECEKYGIAQVMITTGELVRNCGSELLGEQINTEHPIEAPYLYGMQGYEERKHSAFKLIPSSFGKDVKINLSCTPDGYIGEERKDLMKYNPVDDRAGMSRQKYGGNKGDESRSRRDYSTNPDKNPMAGKSSMKDKMDNFGKGNKWCGCRIDWVIMGSSTWETQ